MAVLGRTREPLLSVERRRPTPDFILMFCALALGLLGVLMVYSASAPRLEELGSDPGSMMRRQLLFLAVAMIAFVAASFYDYRHLKQLAPFVYVALLLGLILVLTPLGQAVDGAQRWISLGGFQVQTSELAKPAMIVVLAALLAGGRSEALTWKQVGRALVLVAVPSALIFRQPDLGTMLVFAFVAGIMLFAGGATVRQIGVLLGGGVIGLSLIWRFGWLRAYQIERLQAFLDPAADPTQAGYNLRQSTIAIGSGQIFGKGLFDGTQTNLSFVPAQTTDFIFTAIAEQLGFVGAALVLLLYAVLIWRLLMVAVHARDRFGSLTAVGVAALMTFHVFVNVGMTIGIMPVTGLPLPFVSQGGSFFVAMAVALGVAHSVWLRRSPVPGETYIV